MKTKWPKVKLGGVLRIRKEFVTIDDPLPSILAKAFKGEL
jgi:hypothetical protein